MFVIDTTNSMGKDLAAVQQKTAEIVKETAGTPNAPYNYILVTFNDPGKAVSNSSMYDEYYNVKNVFTD